MQQDPNSEDPFDGFGAPNRRTLHLVDSPGGGGARYKSMSPARLPISRSPCLTIPPGLSPTALLDSPVLLSNIKAEPSPTTGTFYMHSIVNDANGSNTSSSPRETSKNTGHDEGSFGDFEFKPLIRSFSSGLSSLGHLVYAGSKQQEHEPSKQVEGQSQNQMWESVQLVKVENSGHSSQELAISVTSPDIPLEASTLEATAPSEVSCSESQHMKDSDNVMQALQYENNGSTPSTVVEKSSEDGYNWRKYGQKHVKGSEFPRSYYKCTHPNCQMKKQMERSHDGQITDIIYKGRHDHPKPQPSRRLAVGAILSSQGEELSDCLSSLVGAEEKSLNAHRYDTSGGTALSPVSASDDDIEVGGVRSNHDGDEADGDDDPELKRRKKDSATFDPIPIGKPNREPRVVVQTVSEVDILDDGYRWRKYGQKVVKGNPNPRSYYKCTNAGCSVRKHVERASHDPKAVITTYEGKHNHDVPAVRSSGHDTSSHIIMHQGNTLSSHMPLALNGLLRTPCDRMTMPHHYAQTEENDTISLDLGVGISQNHNSNIANEKQQQAPVTQQAQNHEMDQFTGSSRDVMIQASSLSNLYGSSSNGIYGPRDGKGESFSFKTSTVNQSSEHYCANTENLVMGP